MLLVDGTIPEMALHPFSCLAVFWKVEKNDGALPQGSIILDVEKIFGISQITELIKGTQDRNRKRYELDKNVCAYVRK